MSEQTDPRVEIGTAAAVERIQRRYPEGTLARVVADDIAKAVVESAIAALEAAGYTVARLEQVGWRDYEALIRTPLTNREDLPWSDRAKEKAEPVFVMRGLAGINGRAPSFHRRPVPTPSEAPSASPAAPAEPREPCRINVWVTQRRAEPCVLTKGHPGPHSHRYPDLPAAPAEPPPEPDALAAARRGLKMMLRWERKARDEATALLHRCDGQLGLGIYREAGVSDQWKGEASALVSDVRRFIGNHPTAEADLPAAPTGTECATNTRSGTMETDK